MKRNILEKEYIESFKYIKECKTFIYAIIWVFVAFTILGFFVPLPESIYERLIEYFRELIEKTSGYNAFEMTGFIFSNNVSATFLSMMLGTFFGIFSVFNAILNGFVLGVAANMSVFENGILSLWRILPHGVFELPAVFISLGLGLKLGTFVLEKKKLKSFMDFLWKSIRVYIFVILPLLLIAAIIEGVLIVSS